MQLPNAGSTCYLGYTVLTMNSMNTPPPAQAPPPAPQQGGYAAPPPSYSFISRAQHVTDIHRDPSHPGRPLQFLIPGAVLAIIALVVGGLTAYATFSQHALPQGEGIAIIIPVAIIYIAGVYLFSYGYEMQNTAKAIRLTAIVVVVTVLAVFLIAVLFIVLGALGKGDERGGGKSLGRSASHGAYQAAPLAAAGAGTSGGGMSNLAILPFFISTGGGRTRTIVNNITTPITCPNCHQDFVPVKGEELQCPHCHAVLEAHQRPVVCPYCSQAYVPQDTQYKCPNCGAGTPPSLLVDVATPPPPAQ